MGASPWWRGRRACGGVPARTTRTAPVDADPPSAVTPAIAGFQERRGASALDTDAHPDPSDCRGDGGLGGGGPQLDCSSGYRDVRYLRRRRSIAPVLAMPPISMAHAVGSGTLAELGFATSAMFTAP